MAEKQTLQPTHLQRLLHPRRMFHRLKNTGTELLHLFTDFQANSVTTLQVLFRTALRKQQQLLLFPLLLLLLLIEALRAQPD